MSQNQYEIVPSPYMPIDLLKYNVHVSPEGCWRPMSNNKFPVYPFEFTNWVNEELSWYDNCYIHAGLNPFLFYTIKGKDVLRMYSDLSISTFNKFPIGKARHTVLCNDQGKIQIDGIVVRRSEDEFITMCLPDPNLLNQMSGNQYDFTSEDVSSQNFFFQLCGPRSLEIVEMATKEDLHDIKFMFSRDSSIAGKPVFILRTGMAGTLGYEVHGNAEDAVAVYTAIMEAGQPYGITELGRHAYRNAHTEGSIPQIGTHFPSTNPPFPVKITGSLDPNSQLVHRSPIDVGWEKMINFNHDFPGKEALKNELENHHNSMVTLIWDPDDLVAVMKTVFEKGNRCDIMEMVEDYDYVAGNNSIHIDEVYDGDKLIGAASGRMLSPKTNEMISLCTLDQDYAIENKIVEVLWGTPGTRQMRIRAKVSLFPYIKEDRNESFDVENIPHPQF
ncbi:aminomethyltransferase family protein [Acetobacterium wieringae]|uniref:Aminomethyltransferase n=1 Tax=Acetobacterium wieringae TaxID=52694 RepID=A0A1F2PCS3_9FIRM|nr:aminomethyltransferase family protein [Acetobacterium wieringae]OFV69220.1 aminomethyltransferase [Acetobacterium wieringae]